MDLSLFTRKKKVVNFIINDHSIRFLEMKNSKPPIPARWGERYLPNGIINNGKIVDLETLVNILEECVEDWKLKNRAVQFLLPESFVIIRKVQIPADVKDDEVKGYLYLELGASIHLPFDEPVFDCVILKADKDKKEVLIFAAPEENVLDYMELFSSVKLDPVAAEVSPLAIYRLYHHIHKPTTDEDMVVIQFNLKAVNICIFENTVPFFMHHLPLDFDANIWDMKLTKTGKHAITFTGEQEDLDLQFDDVYKEINRIMDFYRYSLHQGKKEVNRILLTGDHPLLTNIFAEMKQRYSVPVEGLDYKEVELPTPFLLSLGLALKGV